MRILAGVPRSGGVKQEWGGENKLFFSFMSRYLENGTKYDQGYYLPIRNCICSFDWHQGWWPWMTLNWYKFKFSRNFELLHIFLGPICQGYRALTFALARPSCIYFVCPNIYTDGSGVWNTATVSAEIVGKIGIFRKPKAVSRFN